MSRQSPRVGLALCAKRVTGNAVRRITRSTVKKFDQNTAVRSLETASINRGTSL